MTTLTRRGHWKHSLRLSVCYWHPLLIYSTSFFTSSNSVKWSFKLLLYSSSVRKETARGWLTVSQRGSVQVSPAYSISVLTSDDHLNTSWLTDMRIVNGSHGMIYDLRSVDKWALNDKTQMTNLNWSLAAVAPKIPMIIIVDLWTNVMLNLLSWWIPLYIDKFYYCQIDQWILDPIGPLETSTSLEMYLKSRMILDKNGGIG